MKSWRMLLAFLVGDIGVMVAAWVNGYGWLMGICCIYLAIVLAQEDGARRKRRAKLQAVPVSEETAKAA